MTALRYNNQGGTLGAGLTNNGTTITFTAAPNFATLTGGQTITLVLDAGTSNMEIVYLTAYTASATTGTITRAAEDSAHWPAVTHASGTGTWIASATINDFNSPTFSSPVTVPNGGTGAATLTGLVKGNGTSTMTAVTAPTGTVVGTSDAQVLTNKDLTGAGNVFPTLNQNTSGTAADLSATLIVGHGGTGATSLTGLVVGNGTSAMSTVTAPGGTVVGTNDTQALTHKDLTGTGNTFPTFNQNTTGSSAKWATPVNLAGNATDGSVDVPFANKFLVQGTGDAGLTGAQFMGGLGTGIVKNTTTTGVQSIATPGTDYYVPGGALGTPSSATLTNASGLPESGVVNLTSDLALKATLASPTFTGTVTIPDGSALGTPTTLILTNASGLPESGVTNLTSDLAGKQAGPLTGDVTTSGAASTLVETTNVDSIVRTSAYSGLVDQTGTKGGSAVPSGAFAAGVRTGVTDVIIGDSICKDGGTFGSTDWGSVLASTENREAGLPNAGPGWVPCRDSIDSVSWSNLSQGAIASGTGLLGPSGSTGFATSWKLSTGNAIGDNRTFRRVKIFYQVQPNGDGLTLATTGNVQSATVDTNVTVTPVTMNNSTSITASAFTGAQVGDIVTITSTLTGSPAIPANTVVSQINGGTMVLSAATTGGSGTATINFTGYRLWDSTDLGSIGAGTGITATFATHVTGSGGGGAIPMGARYYNTDGTNGVTMDNFGIGGQPTSGWGNSPTNASGWVQWLTYNAQWGTPIRRLYVVSGLNDNVFSQTPSLYRGYLTNIITKAAAVSPLTEVILVGEHYGDVIVQQPAFTSAGSATVTIPTGSWNSSIPANSLTQVSGQPIPPLSGAGSPPTVTTISGTNLTLSSGTNVTASATVANCNTTGTSTGITTSTTNGFQNLYVGMIVSGTGITAGTKITVINSTTSITVSAAASLTNITLTFGDVLYFTNLRGGASNWKQNWTTSMAEVAAINGCRFVNCYDRFGDISIQSLVQLCTTTAGSQTVTVPGGGFPNVAVGQYVESTSQVYFGTQVLAVSGNTLTLNTPAATTNTGTLYFTNDVYGIAAQSSLDIHIGDQNASWSGRDGQRSMAGFIYEQLAATTTPASITPNAANIQSVTSPASGTNTITVPVNGGTTIVTNGQAAALTIVLSINGAVDGMVQRIKVIDASAASQTLTWTNTENPNTSLIFPAATLGVVNTPTEVECMYNFKTSKWRGNVTSSPGPWVANADTSASTYASTNPGNGTKITPSATTDVMVYLSVVTSATLSVTQGPSTGAENTVYPSTATTNKIVITLRIPKGHSYVVNFTAGTPTALTFAC